MMKPDRFRQGSLKTEIASEIRQKVFLGELVPGTKIDQDALASEFGVSKLPIRESLIMLESEALVINEPRRGWFVAELTPEDVLDHYRILSYVSGLMAGRAAVQLDDDRRHRLEALLDGMSPDGDQPSPDVLEELNFEFHWIVNSATSSRRLRSTLRLFSEAIPARFFETVPDWSTIAYEDHRKVLEAIRDRDVEGARLAMTDHILRGGAHVVRYLADRGFWSDRVPRASEADGFDVIAAETRVGLAESDGVA